MPKIQRATHVVHLPMICFFASASSAVSAYHIDPHPTDSRNKRTLTYTVLLLNKFLIAKLAYFSYLQIYLLVGCNTTISEKNAKFLSRWRCRCYYFLCFLQKQLCCTQKKLRFIDRKARRILISKIYSTEVLCMLSAFVSGISKPRIIFFMLIFHSFLFYLYQRSEKRHFPRY